MPLKYFPRYFFFLSFFNKSKRQQPLVGHLTLDDEFPVLIARVLHGVKGLLGDAVEVHIPPVFQHLEGDVCTVDHCSRCLESSPINSLAHGLLGSNPSLHLSLFNESANGILQSTLKFRETQF